MGYQHPPLLSIHSIFRVKLNPVWGSPETIWLFTCNLLQHKRRNGLTLSWESFHSEWSFRNQNIVQKPVWFRYGTFSEHELSCLSNELREEVFCIDKYLSCCSWRFHGRILIVVSYEGHTVEQSSPESQRLSKVKILRVGTSLVDVSRLVYRVNLKSFTRRWGCSTWNFF